MNAWRRLARYPWLPHALALLGGILYGINAYIIARTKTSFLDEGLYLYKGWLFLTGVYRPYQDYGPWTNHTPLVFLIHGAIQRIFGPGLATGRYFMIVLGLLTCLGLWILARRWGGNWWAAGIVWAVALNPAEIKIYTLAISEGLIAAMFVWMLVLVLGVRRATWQILLGSAMAGIMLMTRVNLAFVLPIFLLFVLWRYGWKMAILAGLVGVIVVLGLNLLYWPDILKAWAWWLPKSLTPFLSPWRIPPGQMGQPVPPDETSNPFTIFLYIWMTFRLHFVALVSALAVWLLWPARKRPLTERMRVAVFLSVLLIVLLAAHMQAAFTSACVSCVLLYVANFDFLGLLLFVVSFRFLARRLPAWRRAAIAIVGGLVILGVGFSTYEDVSSTFANGMIERMNHFYWWNVLQYFFAVQPLMLFRQTFSVLVSLTVLLLWIAFMLLWPRFTRERQIATYRMGFAALNILLAASLLLTPTVVLGKGNDFFDCGNTNVLQSYEQAGKYLASVIPAGSKIYWDGRLPAVFLYVPGVLVYPPQLNHVHSYFTGGNPDILYRFNHWDDILARQWIQEADYVLLQKGYVQDWERAVVSNGDYVQLDSTKRLQKCEWQSAIDVYRRLKP